MAARQYHQYSDSKRAMVVFNLPTHYRPDHDDELLAGYAELAAHFLERLDAVAAPCP